MIYNEDCIETMKRIPDKSIDLMITDTPYNTTQCEWEYEINLSQLWIEWLRIGKDNCAFIFTAQQPFTTDLIMSNRKMFKYSMVWEKSIATNHLNATKQPLRIFEDVIVFYNNQCTYNPQGLIAGTFKNSRPAKAKFNKGENIYGKQREFGVSTQSNYPNNLLSFANGNNESLHPTQKPLNLFRYLIKTYSNENDLVYDGYMGSGTTAMACIEEKRNYIGAELNKEYFDIAVKRIENAKLQTSLF